ncbi:NYN domain-containing protein [Candidatus Peregrinibacteria bacterium CG10_big_fil_rev_8_21_14_0_10_49_16]|nr:MAG: NYN domain-containing protein [Candidatus Peregrinibacteria bacterium CG22_combo_CG10-13_8_21_14_all_49_11]PIR52318.1 MAG: NYN domain-containing protein [Candidatus Peregrinibacteria bacterium CG10_big_fil_rev_8_21_14_0_10_49_16]
MIFIDGQNLFHAARKAFGYTYPNVDPLKLAQKLCTKQKWTLEGTRFYTGVPDSEDDPDWHKFWTAKKLTMARAGVHVYSRPLRYRNKTVTLPDGTSHSFLVGEEKGIDVRIALDIINLAHKRKFDVVLVLSQDQDLSEVADELRVIAREQKRWIKIVSAFPGSPTVKNTRGINNTDWIRIDRKTYDSCLDPKDYRPKKKPRK